MSNLSPTAARMVRAFDDCYEMPHDDNWQALCIAAHVFVEKEGARGS